MNKNAKTKATTKQDIFNKGEISWKSVDDILSGALEGDSKILLPLADGVTMTIFFTDNDYDFGSINLYGFMIEVTYRLGKHGMFLSFPSVKGKKGYRDLVTCFDKDFHALVKELLEKVYAE